MITHMRCVGRVWALDLYAGNGESGLEHNSTWAGFQVVVTLTETGMDHIFEVSTPAVIIGCDLCDPCKVSLATT